MSRILRAFAFLVAAIAWVGVLLQGYLTMKLTLDGGRSIGDGLLAFFGYFTVLTNILVCLCVSSRLTTRAGRHERLFSSPVVAGGIAAAIAFVALSYHFLLRNVWNPQGAQWVADVLLHYVIPILFLLYWFLCVRSGTLRWHHPLLWSIYPALYFIYVLIRGEIIGTYPYGFIDVAAIGYGRVSINAIGLLVGFDVLGLIIVAIDRAGRMSSGDVVSLARMRP